MSRVVKENSAGNIEFLEELVDPDGDNLTLDEIILEKKDGKILPSSQQSPSWFDYNTNQTTNSKGETLLEVFIRLDASELNEGTTYTFKLVGSDPFESKTNRVDLDVRFP